MNDNFSLKEKMAVNIKWVGLGQIIGYAIQFFVWAILARLLPPNSFGALSIALVFSNLVFIFNELGMGSAIIQRKELAETHRITTFWTCVVMGLLFFILAVLMNNFIAHFFGNPAIGPIIIVFSLKFLVDSLGMVHVAMLRRGLYFRKLTFIDIHSSLTYGLVAVFMAFKGFGIISMAWGYLAGSLARIFLLWRAYYFRPYLGFDLEGFRGLFKFGKNIVGFKIFSFLTGSIDFVLIGKFLGATGLGFYSMALNLVNFPRQKLSFIISTVAFPAFSRIQDDLNQMRLAYLKIVRYTAIISFPLLVGLMILSPQFVMVVYTSRWIDMVLPLRILCIYGICFSITTFIGIVFDSTGHPEYSFRFSLVTLVGTVLAILFGIRYGLAGVAIGLSIYAVIINILGHLVVRHIIKIDLVRYIMSMLPAMFSSGIMFIVLFLIMHLQRNLFMLTDVWFLIIMAIVGAVIYASTLFLISKKTFMEILEILCKMFQKG